MGVQVVGTGSFVPDNVVTNDDLASLGCDSDWIIQRTGIRERRHAPPEMTTSDMAIAAAERAMKAAGVKAADVDLVILGTFTPDYLLPQTATTVQHRLGLNCPAMDLAAACAGFMYSFITAAQFVANGTSKCALVIGADCNSRALNPSDVKTYPLFGDGAGAVIMTQGSPEQGMLAYTLGADGAGTEVLLRRMGGAKTPFDPAKCSTGNPWLLEMDGRPVFKWAVRLLEDTFAQVLEGAGHEREEVKLWILHQANQRIIDAATGGFNIDPKRVPVHLDRYGNTSGGSIPIALDEAMAAGQISRGDLLMFCGFGAGLSWGTALVRW
jgi:3-oxoacyl-[acyl-carrier-protein] synthase-3